MVVFTMELLEGMDFVTYVRGSDPDQQERAAPADSAKTVGALSPGQIRRLRSALPQLAEGWRTARSREGAPRHQTVQYHGYEGRESKTPGFRAGGGCQSRRAA